MGAASFGSVRRALRVVLAVLVVAGFAGFAVAHQSTQDIAQLRDHGGSWNVARPVIEEAAANLRVASSAALLLLSMAMCLAAAGGRAARRRGLGRADWVVAGVAGLLVVAGATRWWYGARAGGGLGDLLGVVDTATTLDVFDGYDGYVSAWRHQAQGLLLLSLGGFVALGAPLLWRDAGDVTVTITTEE